MLQIHKRMNHGEVENYLRDFLIQELGVSRSELKGPSTRLIEDLACDSLDAIELAVALELELDIIIPDGDLDEIITFGQAVEYLHKRLNE